MSGSSEIHQNLKVPVINTRPRDDEGNLSELLSRASSGQVIKLPITELVARAASSLDLTSKRPTSADMVIVTSANALKLLHKRALAALVENRYPVAVIGQKTAQIACDLGLNVIYVGDGSESGRFAEGLISFLDTTAIHNEQSRQRARLILLRGSSATPELPRKLSDSGYQVEEIAVYDSINLPDSAERVAALCERIFSDDPNGVAKRFPAIIVFTSSLNAKLFFDLVPEEFLARICSCPVCVIGEKTFRTCSELRFENIYQAEFPSMESIAELVASLLDEKMSEN